MSDTGFFTQSTFDFLTDLADNNDRDWFEENRSRYQEDLKWKDFIGVHELPKERVTSPELPAELAGLYRAGGPFVRFLCRAVEVPF